MSRGWSKNIIQKNPCFFRTSLIQIIFNTVSWVGPVFWRLLFWIEVISIQYSKAFKSCMCSLLSGPTLQRIQLLFPPGACNLPAFHRGLISSSEAAPVGMFFLLLLLLTNIPKEIASTTLPNSLWCCHPHVAGAAETQFIEYQQLFLCKSFGSVQHSENRGGSHQNYGQCYVLDCSNQTLWICFNCSNSYFGLWVRKS